MSTYFARLYRPFDLLSSKLSLQTDFFLSLIFKGARSLFPIHKPECLGLIREVLNFTAIFLWPDRLASELAAVIAGESLLEPSRKVSQP